MSLAFESPTRVSSNSEAYFTPLNMPTLINKEESSSTASTPYYTAPINPAIHQEFLNAIQARHAAQPTLPVTSNMSMSSSIAMRRNSAISPIDPARLNQILSSSKLLLLDVRSFVQYSHAKIRGAINISIPNTILKRPTFTLEKVYDAIVLDQAREKLKSWQSAEFIVFYEQSSLILQENSASSYLATKLVRAGFKGKLHYLKGGFEAFIAQFKSSCESSNLDTPSSSSKLGPPTISGEAFIKTRPKLRLNNLPAPALGPFTAPMPQFENQAFNPFFSNIRQNMELSHGPIRERFPIRLPSKCNLNHDVFTCLDTLPRCLAGGHLNVSQSFVPPSWLLPTITENGAKLLAESYENIERTEQKRLQNIMHFHSKHTSNPSEYPFSIVAGIEMGALNRYTNIWPYEYTRVKIQQPKGSSDYINASFIQYIDSKETISDARPDQVNTECIRIMKENNPSQPYRRYISTQGPLPATFNDFWQVVWEQGVRVLVMLTKEEEMNKIKCHRYWPDQLNVPTTYGDLTITLTNQHYEQLNPSDEDDVIITRQLQLTYKDQTRQVIHLQYTGWVDFGVPDNPLGALQIIHRANQAQGGYTTPMIVHCSAGCGRSGAFCAIDTVLYRLTHSQVNHDVLLETISRFREQRQSMVQTLRQFVFCYEAIWWWLLGYGPNIIDDMDTSS